MTWRNIQPKLTDDLDCGCVMLILVSTCCIGLRQCREAYPRGSGAKRTIAETMARMSDKAGDAAERFEYSKIYALCK